MADIETAPQTALADAGNLVAYNEGAAVGANPWQQVPIAPLVAAADLAATALQPSAVGGMAYESPAGYVTAAAHAAEIASLNVQIATLTAQVDQLSALIGAGGISVYAPGVYEPGVYV